MKRLFFHIVSITLLMDAVFGGSYVQPQQYKQVQVVHHYIYAPPPPPPPPYGMDGFDSYGTLNSQSIVLSDNENYE
ncbi:unnamed protein product [Nippostrongylus brasiliensis]|uniref:Uncharacterized protein n=1 Tax=Nippostrongylus brasiliensis TaxID=27835 RepID=A0A0N4Y9L9_NIPBR|nr:unnamed protein product [Nippostrongylus brasiliensis]